MIILGVDPGLSVTGYGIMVKKGSQISILDYGAVKFSSKNTLPIRIGQFYAFFNEAIPKNNITHISLETPFLGKNAQNFLKLGYLRGILYLLADQHNCTLAEFSPRQVKKAVTGSGAAPKEQVARVLTRLFKGLETPKTLDISDALAVTLCGAWQPTHTQL